MNFEDIVEVEEIERQWAIDSKIDLTNLNITSSVIFELHSKYFKFINATKKALRTFEAEKKRMVKWRTDYYLGNLPLDFLKEKDWKPRQEKPVLKSEVEQYLSADELIIDLNLSIGECNDIIDFCDSIIKSIQNRSFTISNIIAEKKFMNGGY